MTPEYEAVSPTTDPARLAELAQTHPQLRPMIAANPAAYDGLLQWLTQFDEPGLKSALAARGFAAAPVVAQKKRRIPLVAIIIGAIVALLLVGVGVTALVISLNQAPTSSTSSSMDDDEDEDEDEDDEDTDEDEEADDDPVEGIETCTLDQVLTVFYGDVDPSTVDLAGSFTLPEVLDASTTTVCAGDYFSTDEAAFKQATSIAVLEDDGKVIERLTEILSASGFGEPLDSGMSTIGWTDGTTQIYALNLEDAVFSDTDEFGGIDDKIIVFVWEA